MPRNRRLQTIIAGALLLLFIAGTILWIRWSVQNSWVEFVPVVFEQYTDPIWVERPDLLTNTTKDAYRAKFLARGYECRDTDGKLQIRKWVFDDKMEMDSISSNVIGPSLDRTTTHP
jgi:hypothetical protein